MDLQSWYRRRREGRGSWLFLIYWRVLVGFALLPAGTKKVLGQPFIDPAKESRFATFLDAFHATGAFYHLVGVLQIAAALLLMTQYFATLGAAIALPIFVAITSFCLSTHAGIPTCTVATLLTGSCVVFLLWESWRWQGLFVPDFVAADRAPAPVIDPQSDAPIELSYYAWAGLLIALLFFVSTFAVGGVYRPKGAEFSNPSFYVMPVLLLLPALAWAFELRARRSAKSSVDANRDHEHDTE